MIVLPPPGPRYLANIPPERGIRTAQIICAAMIGGVVFFLGIALFSSAANAAPAGLPMLSYMASGFAAIAIVLRFFVPGLVIQKQSSGLKDIAPEALDGTLFGLFQTKMIIGLALLEGAAFFNLVALIAEHQMWTLAVVGALLILMAMMFPTLAKFEAWAMDRKRDLQNQF